MSRIVIVILIYHCHKPIYLIYMKILESHEKSKGKLINYVSRLVDLLRSGGTANASLTSESEGVVIFTPRPH
jgi:hypothetical protein